MTDYPAGIQWQEPYITTDAESEELILSLGFVHLPASVNTAKAESVLLTITDLVNQMVEEDILPELFDMPEEDDDGDALDHYDRPNDPGTDEDYDNIRTATLDREDEFYN